MQTYLALCETARGLVDDTELEWADKKRVSFLVDNLVDASAPSNNPLLNPMVLKAVVDTGGRNLVGGARRFVRDMATSPRVPSMVEPDAFEVGRDLGVSGARWSCAPRCSSSSSTPPPPPRCARCRC